MPKNAVKLAPQPKTKSTDFALIDATRFEGGSGLVLGGSGLDWGTTRQFHIVCLVFYDVLACKARVTVTRCGSSTLLRRLPPTSGGLSVACFAIKFKNSPCFMC